MGPWGKHLLMVGHKQAGRNGFGTAEVPGMVRIGVEHQVLVQPCRCPVFLCSLPTHRALELASREGST